MPFTYETKIGCGNWLHAFTHNILIVIMILFVSDYSSRRALCILGVYYIAVLMLDLSCVVKYMCVIP